MSNVRHASQVLTELAAHLNRADAEAQNAVNHLIGDDPEVVENYMGNAIDHAKKALGGLRAFVESAKKVDKWDPRSKR
jgi:hypothetical protein